MKKSFSLPFMENNCGCYSQEQLHKLSFMKREPNHDENVSIQSILESEIPLKDKYWFVIRKSELTDRQKQELAIGVAEIVLEIYEKKYPNNKAPREAIQAAKDYLNNVIGIEELRIKRYAAYAAYAAADAAYAAYAAADAADAAYAAYAAYAAADAAADAAYAAADANPKKLFSVILLQYLMDFVVAN